MENDIVVVCNLRRIVYGSQVKAVTLESRYQVGITSQIRNYYYSQKWIYKPLFFKTVNHVVI